MALTSSQSRFLAWSIWMIASIFYAYQYLLRVIPKMMLEDIMQQFGIGTAAFGQFTGVYYIGYSLLHLPLGIMIDRYGPRNVMTGCILLTVAGLLPLLYAEQWIYPVVGRFLIGLGSTAAILGVYKVIRLSFDEKKYSRMLSLSTTIGLAGAIYGGGPAIGLRESIGFDGSIQVIALAGVVLAAVTYFFVPDSRTSSDKSVWFEIKEILFNRKVIWMCFFAGFTIGPLEGFADVWGSVFLKNVYNYEGTVAAALPSIIYIGMCLGTPLLSFIAERRGNYLGTIMGACCTNAIIFVALLFWQFPVEVVFINFFLIGICCGSVILAIYKVTTYVQASVSGLAIAVANMIVMIFGYAFHTVLAGVVNAMGGTSSPEALTYATAVIPLTLALGAFGFAILYAAEKRVQHEVQPGLD
jgi:predicted MFS family arabinose efflux permease